MLGSFDHEIARIGRHRLTQVDSRQERFIVMREPEVPNIGSILGFGVALGILTGITLGIGFGIGSSVVNVRTKPRRS